MWKLLAPGVGLGDLLTPEYNFSVLSRTEKEHVIFFLKRALCTTNLPKRAHRKNWVGR